MRRSLVRRTVFLAVTAVSLYIVFPGLIELWGSTPRLRSVFPLWILPIFVLEGLAFVCMWELLRIAPHVRMV